MSTISGPMQVQIPSGLRMTIIEWDGVNTSATGYDGLTGTGIETGCVIGSTALDLTTPDDVMDRSEILLHTSSKEWWISWPIPVDMNLDDFAIRYEWTGSATDYGFLNPIQE